MKIRQISKVVFLLVAGMWVAVSPMASAPITRQKALQNAREFLQQKGVGIQNAAMRHAPLHQEGNEAESAPYYVFNVGGDNGYVIASGDDCAYPVLGYSDLGSFDADNIPEGMKNMLDFYAEQIRSFSKSSNAAKAKSSTTDPAVEPMLTTKWGQDEPYNDNCPIDITTNERSVTGCVATAMAQVMYYHRKHSTTKVMKDIPRYSIFEKNEMEVASIPKGSPIDWDNMLDSYNRYSTKVQKQAVANLMLYCGTSVKMHYGSSSSGAFDIDMVYAMPTYFDYDDGLYSKYRDDYTDTEWEAMVYEELGQGRPLYYAASSHAFVVDGHDGNGYVHINWGWDGWSNDYFRLTAVSSDEKVMNGFTFGQTAVFGVVPNGFFPRLTTKALSLTSGKVVDNLSSRTSVPATLSMTVANLTGETHSFEQAVGLYKQGKLQSVVSQVSTIGKMASGATKKLSASVELDPTLPPGAYILMPISRLSGSDKWRKNGDPDLFVTVSIYGGSAHFVVGVPEAEGDLITFACDDVRKICIENWDLNGDGAFSKEEAAAVTNLNNKFSYKKITSFDELQYFTGLTKIKNGEFINCSDLASVIIPPNVKLIDNGAFKNCNLKHVVIPRSVTSLGEEVFRNNKELEDVIVENGNPVYDSRNDCRAMIETATNRLIRGGSHSVIPEDVVAIGPDAFSCCIGLKTLRIPESVTRIEDFAFWCCSNLTTINIPSKVTYIGSQTFSNCSSLTEITIPSSVTSMGGYVFSKCSSLSSVNFKPGMTSISVGAFEDCVCLTSFTIPSCVTSIERRAFYGCTSLASITIPSNVTSIGGSAFTDCTGLTSVRIPKSVKTIGGNPFYGCSNLQRIVVDAGNAYYKSDGNNSAIIEIATKKLVTGCAKTVIPNDIEVIGDFAFYGCAGLTSIVIPAGVTTIERYAFYQCKDLTSLTLPNSLKSIGERAFTWCVGLTAVNIPSSVTSIGEAAFRLCSSLQTINIPSGVTSISEETFSDCTSLKSINIPFGVTSIGRMAFSRCKELTAITIPSSVTRIDNYAFEICNGLTTIKTYVTDVFQTGKVPFSNCVNATLYVPKGLVEKYKSTPDWNKLSMIKEMDNSYDINGDGFVSVSDVTSLVNMILGTAGDVNYSYDINGDGNVSVSDVTTLVRIILGQ